MTILMRTQLRMKELPVGGSISRVDRTVTVNDPKHTNIRYGCYVYDEYYCDTDDEEYATNFLYRI